MALQFIFNVGLAFLWLILAGSGDVSNFLFGYVLGAIFLYMFYSHRTTRYYLVTVWKILVLLFVFFKEVLVSNLNVLIYVFRPICRLHPGIVAMEVDFKSDFELTLLTSLITLTPGTLTIEVAPDDKKIYIHALDCSEPEKVVQHIRDTFEKCIKEVAGYYD